MTTFLLLTCLLLLWQPQFSLQQRTRNYQLEDNCSLNPVSISLDETVIIKAGGTVSPKPIGVQCKITVMTEGNDLQVNVRFINFRDCSVTLSLYALSNHIYTCDNYPSSSVTLPIYGTQVIVDLKKTNPTALQYSFEISITPKQKPISPDSTESQPVAAGLVVGIVCGIFFFLVVGAIVIACCYRRAQKLKRLAMYSSSNNKVPLETLEGQIGISNNYESSPRAKTKLLSPEREMSVDGSVESGGGRRPQTLDVRSRGQAARSDHTESSNSSRSQKNVAYEHEEEDPYDVMDGDPKPPKSPFLSALQGNVKFQKSRQENERDAEDRRNRLSGSSFGNQTPGESNSSLDSRGKAPSADNRGKPLPVVPSNKELTLAEKRKKMESFRRATRPESFTSDELDRSGDDTDNLNQSRGASGSDSQSSKEGAPAKGRGAPVNSKPNTQHTLRPNRGQEKMKNKNNKGKAVRELQKAPDSPRSIRSEGRFQKTEDGLRGSKRSNRSPKPTTKGFGHRRNRSTDSRPTTPTSMMRDDDEESIRPLQRTTSRQSLYASRSSLYSRRRRRGSFTESVVSGSTFAHDDIDYYRRSRGHSQVDYDDDYDDGYVEPISRRDNSRMFKSLGDLNSSGRRGEKATRATQTLRETATQTGEDQSVVVHSKRVVQRKRRSKSLSATGTQTTNRKHRSRSKSRADDSDTGDELKNNKREKSKSRESLKETSDKPKPKPKPKPRKSHSTAQSETEAPVKSQRKKSKSQGKSEKEEEAAQEMPAPPPGMVMYPMGPQGQPYVVPYGLPPGYTTLPHQPPPPGVVSAQGPYVVNGQSAYTVAPPQHGMPSVGQLPPQTAPQAGPRKSNWDMLCELTDKQNSGEALETGSVASSVFTNNVPTHQVVYPGGTVTQNGHHPGAHIVMLPPQQGHPVHPFVSPPGPQTASGVPLVVNPPSSGPIAQPSPSVGSELSHNSSWDVLMRLSEQQNQLQQAQHNAAGNESVV